MVRRCSRMDTVYMCGRGVGDSVGGVWVTVWEGCMIMATTSEGGKVGGETRVNDRKYKDPGLACIHPN